MKSLFHVRSRRDNPHPMASDEARSDQSPKLPGRRSFNLAHLVSPLSTLQQPAVKRDTHTSNTVGNRHSNLYQESKLVYLPRFERTFLWSCLHTAWLTQMWVNTADWCSVSDAHTAHPPLMHPLSKTASPGRIDHYQFYLNSMMLQKGKNLDWSDILTAKGSLVWSYKEGKSIPFTDLSSLIKVVQSLKTISCMLSVFKV